MRIDKNLSEFHEAPDARELFNRTELKRCKMLLRRLQFLEAQIRDNGGLAGSGNDGAAFIEWEAEALEWVLKDIGYLPEKIATGRNRK